MITASDIDAIKTTLADVGDTIILKYFDTVEVEDKFGTAVTQADREAGVAINATLAGICADAPILNEETAAITEGHFIETVFNSKCFWTVDPIDGTSNYSMGNPNFCTGISLCECEERTVTPVWGMMFDPTRKGFVYLDEDGVPVYELLHSGYRRTRTLGFDAKKLDALKKGRIVAVRPDVAKKATHWRFEEVSRNQFIESQVMNGMMTSSGKLTAAVVGGHLWDFAAPFAVARALGLGPYRLNGTAIGSMRQDEFILDGDDPDIYWRLTDRQYIVIVHPSIKPLFFKEG